MESSVLVRLLCLTIAALSSGLAATITSWIVWAAEPNLGEALLTGGCFFAAVSLWF
ncbi:hypothetical protein [Micromonospora sp. NPDC051006]|uniref:hypothetical protein n=1 Tax=Micromonospora sp. NPDC051006 TaxID=3364283 RepID=UPI0037B6DB0C